MQKDGSASIVSHRTSASAKPQEENLTPAAAAPLMPNRISMTRKK
jgi:hypothetical protein